MRPVSARFLDAITGSHTVATRLRAVPTGQIGTQPTGGTALSLLGGDVTLDGTANIRSTISCEIEASDPLTGGSLWPASSYSELTPYGVRELYVERGVILGGGTVEYVSLGYFRIDDVEQPDAPGGPIRLAGSDRMSHIIDATMLAPVQFTPTQTYGDVLSLLVLDAYPDAVIEWIDLDGAQYNPIGRTANVDDDRYAFLAELMTGIGKVFYFDHRGVLVIKSDPDPGLPVWTVSRGERGVMISASRSLSRSGVYNGVIATGEGMDTAAPARGIALDSDPDSPTQWGGPFGKVPRLFASPLLTSDAQARLAAATVLRRSTGLPYSVSFSAVPNPALEPGDPIAIGIEGAPVQVAAEQLVADAFSRTVVNGVGTADTGQAWSIAAGANAAWQVAGGVLAASLNTNVSSRPTIVGIDAPDVELTVDVRAPIAAAGGSLVFGFVIHSPGTSSDYQAARFEFNADLSVTYKLSDQPAGGGLFELLSLPSVDTYTSGQWWSLRMRTVKGTVWFKAWPRDEAEPQAWAYRFDGIPPRATTGNRFGLYTWRISSNTNTGPQFQFDNFRALSVPPSTLRGGELHVLDTLSVPLTTSDALTGTTRQQTLVTIETSS